ncbi:TPA: helix-turn-helix domain-containing protein [Burkholderia vietnamiensis]|uniref:helix-turn-helix domain-containing protein n=1 Tax=Burkholderia vietnamiensis TaxID=60552 RepID=UPI00075DF646|nr:helix-turn-helix domain-containing protein [Burkholderia vietnamiensis]KVS13678.1 DNA-binding protein [Burkholderia vietnamiensis]MCA8211978.1 helix-turn-helix domain-containing protein [Burkholderia vietnamiensis]HDR9102696.1 helix-turn-helix domain-containing protein [Burkholderia vietnamiensis]HDR9122512.1 helix-turn-helix domain-containing protein [Burkholderia vietnamiensis]HDR9172289.1 helix-turn-helix domain-containing protein [Burkholderia vietnamiensis]
MAAAAKPQATSAVDKSVAAKWSAALTKAGWTSFPNVIFERQQALGLTPLDINILLHLAGYWWRPGENAHPSKATIAKAIGVTARTVQKRIAAMETAGFIQRIYRKTGVGDNDTNEYDLRGLIEAAKPFAEEKIAERERRQREQAERLTRKRPLSVVKGGKAS